MVRSFLRSWRHLFGAAASLAVLLAATEVLAQPDPRAADGREPSAAQVVPLAERLGGAARAEYDAARVLYQAGDFAGARRKFEEALRLSSEPRLLWNIAACEKGERRYARARSTLERYVRSAADLTTEERSRADELVENLAPFVSTLLVDVEPEGAELVVDGEVSLVVPARAPKPPAVFLDLGKHRAEVRKPGWVTASRDLDLRGGDALPFQVRLERDVRVGTLRIATEEDATIVVDRVVRGTGSARIDLPPGVHALRISAPDRRDFVTDVVIENRVVRTMEVTLEDDDDGLVPAWVWFAGGGLLLAGAATAVILVATDSGGVTPVRGSFGSIDIGEF